MSWWASQAIEFGSDGKMLVDTEENRWVIPSVDALPPADREKFLKQQQELERQLKQDGQANREALREQLKASLKAVNVTLTSDEVTYLELA